MGAMLVRYGTRHGVPPLRHHCTGAHPPAARVYRELREYTRFSLLLHRPASRLWPDTDPGGCLDPAHSEPELIYRADAPVEVRAVTTPVASNHSPIPRRSRRGRGCSRCVRIALARPATLKL
jgi:hypothetical protein